VVVTSYSNLTSKFVLFFSLLTTVSCSYKSQNIVEHDPILHGNITYPFAVAPPAIGKNVPKKDFVISSQSGGTMYSVAIPGEARDFNVEIPLAELSSEKGYISKSPLGSSMTDREIVNSFPAIEKNYPEQTALTDEAFGVTPSKSSAQGPSYTMGISEVKHFYKSRKYEVALVKINHLISFYPNSPQLYKMKGTVLKKLGSYDLALSSWQKAYELAPTDKSLKVGIDRLQNQYMATTPKQVEEQSTPSTDQGTGDFIPLEGQTIESLAH
jgi:hypothetical protein